MFEDIFNITANNSAANLSGTEDKRQEKSKSTIVPEENDLTNSRDNNFNIKELHRYMILFELNW